MQYSRREYWNLKLMKTLAVFLFFISNSYGNRAMQEAMQGKVNSDIFKNNSYGCKVVVGKKSSQMTASFKRGEFQVKYLGKKDKLSVLWTGKYQLKQVGHVSFITDEFRVVDPYGHRFKEQSEIVFKVKGNSALFEMKSGSMSYACKRRSLGL